MIITTITIGMLYLTSDEIWTLMNGTLQEIPYINIIRYCKLFAVLNILIYTIDNMRYKQGLILTILISMLSLVIDLFPIIGMEYFMLCTINKVPTDSASLWSTLFIGALPSCLGVFSINSVTSDTLEERVKKLTKDVNELSDRTEETHRIIVEIDAKYKTPEHLEVWARLEEILKERGEKK